MKSNVLELSSETQFSLLTLKYSILNFYATWHSPCSTLNNVFSELSNKYPSLVFCQLQAEEFPQISETFQISSVPTFIIFCNSKELERLEGANAPALASLAEKYSKLSLTAPITAPITSHDLISDNLSINTKLKNIINSNPLMIFIKGTPAEPKCGFSSKLIQLLKDLDCPFGSFDILNDQQVRESLKEYSDWPTYPQVYLNGELLGGLDIIKEMIATGEFQKLLPPPELDINTKLKKLINQAPVMLFMKGNADAPQCGFSRTIVDLLKRQDVEFETFDILQDQQVRETLKEYSEWPTYPQLYSKGELLGGLDIVKEMIESGEFKNALR